MTLSKTPNIYTIADVRRYLFRSRRVFAIIFILFLFVGLYCIRSADIIIQSIGASLIASAIVSIATVWIDHIRSGEQVLAEQLMQSGIQAAFKKRNLVDEYDKYLKNASEIWITGYTLRAFVEHNEDYFHDLVLKERDLKIRMLLVNPTCSAAKTMEEAERHEPGSYISTFEALKKKIANLKNVELRLVERGLPMMIYRIDDIMYTGPYPCFGSSSTAFTLKLARGGWLFDRQMKEFEQLWDSGTVIDLNPKP